MKNLILACLLFQTVPATTTQIVCKGVTMDQAKVALFSRGYQVAESGVNKISTIEKKNASGGMISLSIEIQDGNAIVSGVFEKKQITPVLFKHKESYAGKWLGGTFDSLQVVANILSKDQTYR